MKRRRLFAALGVAGLGLTALAGCGGPQPDLSACEKPTSEMVEAVSRRLDAPGALRHARMLRSADSGRMFVTAELHRHDDRWWAVGDLLTWEADGNGGFRAVDEHARELSTWPGADFTLRDDRDAIESRGCTMSLRGTLDADQHDFDCPPGGIARRDCLEDNLSELKDRLDREFDERVRGGGPDVPTTQGQQ